MTLQRLTGLMLLAAAVTLPVAAARAQNNMPTFNLLTDPPKNPELEERRAREDEAYRAANKKIPVQQPASDPWGSIRAPDPAKPAAAKKQTGAK